MSTIVSLMISFFYWAILESINCAIACKSFSSNILRSPYQKVYLNFLFCHFARMSFLDNVTSIGIYSNSYLEYSNTISCPDQKSGVK